MSTRCTISVKDDDGVYFIYRHHDGYPNGEHGVPATLVKALEFAWPLPRFEADDFAAAIVGAWKRKGGGDIRFTTQHGAHQDTEYQYFITHLKFTIYLVIKDVYSGKTIFSGTLDEAIERFKNK